MNKPKTYAGKAAFAEYCRQRPNMPDWDAIAEQARALSLVDQERRAFDARQVELFATEAE